MPAESQKISLYREKIFSGLVLLGFWLILTARISPLNLMLGTVISVFTVQKFGDRFLHKKKPDSILHYPLRLAVLTAFFFIFLKEALISSWQVMKLTLSPSLQLRGGIVRIEGRLKHLSGLSLVANLITLTPGTMTVELDIEENCYYIHWLHITTEDEEKFYEEIVDPFETWTARLLGIDYEKGS